VIDDGATIINNHPAKVIEGSGPPSGINGTFLVLFEDKIFINETLFLNNKRNIKINPQTPNSHKIKFTDHTVALSLPYLKHVSDRNLDHIYSIKSQLYYDLKASTFSLGSILLILLLTVIFYTVYKKRQERRQVKELVLNLQTGRDACSSRGGIVSTSGADSSV